MAKQQTRIQADGTPRTKGIRNPYVASAHAHNAGPQRHKTDRRAKDARRKREEWA